MKEPELVTATQRGARRDSWRWPRRLPAQAIPVARGGARHLRVRDAPAAEREDLDQAVPAHAVRGAHGAQAQRARGWPTHSGRRRDGDDGTPGRPSDHRQARPVDAVAEAACARARPQRRAGLSAARPSSSASMPSSSPATAARNATRAASTTRRRGRWSRWWARRRWQPRSTACSACAAGCATRSSPPRCRRRWPRAPSTTRAARA